MDKIGSNYITKMQKGKVNHFLFDVSNRLSLDEFRRYTNITEILTLVLEDCNIIPQRLDCFIEDQFRKNVPNKEAWKRGGFRSCHLTNDFWESKTAARIFKDIYKIKKCRVLCNNVVPKSISVDLDDSASETDPEDVDEVEPKKRKCEYVLRYPRKTSTKFAISTETDSDASVEFVDQSHEVVHEVASRPSNESDIDSDSSLIVQIGDEPSTLNILDEPSAQPYNVSTLNHPSTPSLKSRRGSKDNYSSLARPTESSKTVSQDHHFIESKRQKIGPKSLVQESSEESPNLPRGSSIKVTKSQHLSDSKPPTIVTEIAQSLTSDESKSSRLQTFSWSIKSNVKVVVAGNSATKVVQTSSKRGFN